MSPNCVQLVAYPMVLAQRWLSAVLQVTGVYAAVLDPRPDLSIPARSASVPYMFWWW
jgi:hypothetical protein